MRKLRKQPDLKTARRKVLKQAVTDFAKHKGVDLGAMAKIDLQAQKKYDEIAAEIEKEANAVAMKAAQAHLKALSRRLSIVKARGGGISAGDFDFSPFPLFWYEHVKDYLSANACDFEVDVDVDPETSAVTECDCIKDENTAKPYVRLHGGGPGITNSADLETWISFNLDDNDFAGSGVYRISPSVILNGYWLKENWLGCSGDGNSQGTISIKLVLEASQLGGSKVLGSVESTVFEWTSADSFTGAIDKVYNIEGHASSESLKLVVSVEPSDGDVFFTARLEIETQMEGYGRYVVDLKNSNAFYFKVIDLELEKRKYRLGCIPGGPDNRLCIPGGPNSPLCVPGGPSNPVCFIGGPNSGVIECKIGGPNNSDGILCKIGGPGIDIPDNCNAGPSYGPDFGSGIYEHGVIEVDLEKVPQGMKRAFSKMLENISGINRK